MPVENACVPAAAQISTALSLLAMPCTAVLTVPLLTRHKTRQVYEPPQSIPEIVVHMCLIAGGRTTPPMLACISGSDEGVYGPRHSLALVAGV